MNVRIVATRWPVCHTPPRVVTHRICVENPNRIVSHRRSQRRADSDPAEQHPAQADAARREEGVDPGLELIRCGRADERDDRCQRDGRERCERHVIVTADDDHVVRPGREGQPCPPMEEGIREVEEIASPGVEAAVGQPVDDGRDRNDREPCRGRPTRPHNSTSRMRRLRCHEHRRVMRPERSWYGPGPDVFALAFRLGEDRSGRRQRAVDRSRPAGTGRWATRSPA